MAENQFSRNGKFVFTGEVCVGKEVVTDNAMGSSKWKKEKLNVGVKTDDSTLWLTVENIHNPEEPKRKAVLFDKEGNRFEVEQSQTLNDDVIEKCADYLKVVIDLEEDQELKKEYTKLIYKKLNHERAENPTDEDKAKIEEYTKQINELATKRTTVVTSKDLIQILGAIAPDLREKKTKVKVKGNIKLNYYNGNTRLEYHPTSFEIVGKDAAYENVLLLDIFYEKDSIDDVKKEKKMYINGYLAQKVKGEFKLYPVPFVLDYTKIDTEDPNQKLLLEYSKGIFDIKDKKQVHKVSVIAKSLMGAEIKEFDESCLTERQKISIALGKSKIEDFKPKGNIYGDFKIEYRVITDDLKVQPDGTEPVFPTDELVNYLSYDDSDKKAEDVKVEENETSEEDKRKAMMAKLFG